MSLAQPTGVWTNGFGYDAAKRLSNVTSQAGSFAYTLGGAGTASPLPKKILLPNTSYITNTYDSVARLTGTWLKKNDGTTLDAYTYIYNPGNQRTNLTRTDSSTYDFTYDAIGQLKIANGSVNAEDRGYVYDAAWNLNYRTNNGSLSTFTVNTKNELTNAPTVGKQVYDSNGNLIAVGSSTNYQYLYDDENRLVTWACFTNSASSPAIGDRWTDFVYDGLGRLRKRLEYSYVGEPEGPGESPGSGWQLNSEARYLYDGMRVIQERDINNTPTVSYTRGTDLSGSLEGAGGIGGLLARSDDYSGGNWSAHSFYHADGNGNITYLVSSSQTLAASYRYDPFGNTISSSGSLATANVYRFSSKEIHVNSGLYYYGYRWYAPNLQRWLNRDPIGEVGGMNLYGFVINQPVSFVDLFGLEPNKCEDGLPPEKPSKPKPPRSRRWYPPKDALENLEEMERARRANPEAMRSLAKASQKAESLLRNVARGGSRLLGPIGGALLLYDIMDGLGLFDRFEHAPPPNQADTPQLHKPDPIG